VLQPRRLVYFGVFIGALFILSQLFVAGFYARADDMDAYVTVTAGTLSIMSASSSESFDGSIAFAFTDQSATLTDLGGIQVQDARGSGAGWSLALSAADWSEENNSAPGGQHNQLDYDEDGKLDNLGILCVNITGASVLSVAGDDETNVTVQPKDCFNANDGTTSINLVTALPLWGEGQYWIKEFDLSQFIPSTPTAQNLTTTLTYTVS